MHRIQKGCFRVFAIPKTLMSSDWKSQLSLPSKDTRLKTEVISVNAKADKLTLLLGRDSDKGERI